MVQESQIDQNVNDTFKSVVRDCISWRAKGSSKYLPEGQMNLTFGAFPIYFRCIPEVIKGPNYTGWQAGFSLQATYCKPLI